MIALRPALIAGLILCVSATMVISSMSAKSPTADEFSHHVANGYSYLLTRDFRMNPASPPLPRMMAALPLWFMQAKLPLDHVSWRDLDSPEFAKQFFYRANTNADELIFWARVPMVLLFILFGLSVFLIARNWFGTTAAFCSLILYAFCPDIVAHSGLATADLAVAFFFFLTVVSFRDHLLRPRAGSVIRTGVLTGLALLSKFTAILLFPLLLILAVVTGHARSVSPKRTAVFLTVCLLTVWAGYCFEVKPLLSHTPAPEKKAAVYRRIGGEALEQFARKVPVPLSTFASAIVSMAYTRSAGTRAYLLGEWSRQGWWYYYFVAFAVKNTVPMLILILFALLLWGTAVRERTLTWFLWTPVILFFLVTLRDKAQAGIRYFLPIYPFLMISAGVAAADLWKRSSPGRALVAALLLWHTAEAAFVHPDYLAYFNQFAGGPTNGYKVLRDSNLDWGQDLKGAGEYAQQQGYPEVVVLTLTAADPVYYGIPYRAIEGDEYKKPRKTVYAIGAHFIDGLDWTRQIKPTKVIGHSMFIYDLRN